MKIYSISLLSFILLPSVSLTIVLNNESEINGLLGSCSEDFVCCNETNSDEGIQVADFVLPDFPIFPPDDPTIPSIVPSIEVPYYLQESFTTNFFLNSVNNYISNTIGNCAYTSISMLLSYYDSYWHDGFIPSQYDKRETIPLGSSNVYSSPGVVDNTFFSPSSNDLSGYDLQEEILDFINECIENKETSFLGYLLWCTNVESVFRPGTNEDDYISSLGIYFSQFVNILDKYVYENETLLNNVRVEDRFAYNNPSQEILIRQDIVENISAGQPVIIFGCSYKDLNGNNECDGDESLTETAHFCIAYYYDEENDIIYGHGGWGPGNISINGISYSRNFLNLDDYFNKEISGYAYIDVHDELAHSHSNNYVSENGLTTACSCALSNHNHSYNYVPFDSEEHYYRCICMTFSDNESHNFTETIWEYGFEYLVCEDCGYKKEILD